MSRQRFDLAILGSGSGGLAATAHAREAGRLTSPEESNRGFWLAAVVAFVALGVAPGLAAARLSTAPPPAADPPPQAEIVHVEGIGRVRPDARSPWSPAAPERTLYTGYQVQTGARSRMGILFADRTQIRLNQHALLTIKELAGESGTRLGLSRGRAWSRAQSPPRGLTVETPSAAAAIRGTEWELEVDEAGATTLTVLAGEVELANDLGQVRVRASEQAVAEVGKPPVKRLIVNPRDRVQWVTAYAVEPLRWIRLPEGELPPPLAAAFEALRRGARDRRELDRAGELLGAAEGDLPSEHGELAELGGIALAVLGQELPRAREKLTALLERGPRQPDAYLLAAEMDLYAGDPIAAARTAEAGLARFPAEPRLLVELAHIDLYADRPKDSLRRLAEALETAPDLPEVHVATGDWHRREGEAGPARSAYTRAAELDPGEDRAFFGLGAVASEREEVRQGLAHLSRALELNPSGPGYRGELASLLTFADARGRAHREFERAREETPGDPVVLTGQGLLALKEGRPRDALELFLEAGLLAPDYARAHLYAAVAHYQIGEAGVALGELARASELDPRDPLPHLFASIIHTDLFNSAAAVDEARAALALMPNLKSLNQVANDQKGKANLGNAFAFFGLEEWALHLAQESFYPYWAGSHLFLADRYGGSFNKQSENLQGFLTDPTVFGASNRFQTLIPRPGSYRQLDVVALGEEAGEEVQPSLTLNGFARSRWPLAYFAAVDGSAFSFEEDLDGEPSTLETNSGDELNFSGAVGLRPRHDIGLFAFVGRADSNARVRGIEGGLEAELRTDRIDLGGLFRFAPTSQLWLRGSRVESSFSLASFFRDLDQGGAGIRHTFTLAGGHLLTWGAGTDRLDGRGRDIADLVVPADEGIVFDAVPISLQGALDTREAFVSMRLSTGERLLIDAGLFASGLDQELRVRCERSSPGLPRVCTEAGFVETRTSTSVRPRLGLVLRPGRRQVLRLAFQDWHRPAGDGTLAPVATAGIPLADRLVASGGRLERGRVQLESTWNGRLFTQLHADYQEVTNSVSEVIILQLGSESLERVRQGTLVNLASEDLVEEELFLPDRGELLNFGLAVNGIVSRRLSAYLRYSWSDSENTGSFDLFRGRKIPFVADHVASLGATWVSPARFYLTGRASWRSERFEDPFNSASLSAGWDVDLVGYWESRDKRWVVQAGFLDWLDDNNPTTYGFQLLYRP